ncbi:aromatase/cyclase [Actinokineospora cianjurensis]|uniref:Aromatase n=1 Tax=Actinokineospora cianjurensis TaxID=585224 RepID=A0A421AWC6_9PSEU|nr:aromatase/cyclase [Actinokineospora cianjurensis]RLK53972.1 aromatase [Actinokineospora cianjurensis]
MTDRLVEHEISIGAPATTVYRLIAEVANWPRIFPPTIHVDHVSRGADEERIRIWATANGEAKSWTSHRVLDPGALRITFQQEVSSPPVAAMGGTWIVEPLSDRASLVRLLHRYRAVDDDPRSLQWIDEAVDRNSRTELASLKHNVELADGAAAITFSFEDTVEVHGRAEDVYDFVNDAGRWAERLPHVADVHLVEDTGGLQTLEMVTRANDGSTHTTKSYRVTFPHHRIAYKQVVLPALMVLHTGCWTFTDTERGVAASSQHTVVLNTDNIARVLGPDAGVADARDYVRAALSANSRVTLAHAKEYAEKAAGR